MTKYNKHWYKSKTVIASIIGAGIAIASAMYGETNQYVVIAISLASTFGVYGRYKAQGPLKPKLI